MILVIACVAAFLIWWGVDSYYYDLDVNYEENLR